MLEDRDYMHSSYGGGRLSRPEASIVKPLIWANAIVFVLTAFGQDHGLISLVSLHPHYIKNFQIWRLGTYMFAHDNFMHILLNMWGLYLFGKPVERRLGGVRFLNLYFISGTVGAVLWLAMNWNAPYMLMGGRVTGACIGASGAVFGVMIAAGMTFPNLKIMLLFPPIPMKLRTFVVGYSAFTVFMSLSDSGGRVAHIAHLGGILGGLFYMRRIRGGSLGMLDWFRKIRREAEAVRRRSQFKKVDDDDDELDDLGDISVEVDRILDKIGREGIGSLTDRERRILEQARKFLGKKG